MEKRSIVIKNDEVIHYLEQGKSNQTMILIHGNFSSSMHYTPLLKRLPKDIRVIALDLRGFGDSSYHKSIHSLVDFADDMYLFMQELKIDQAIIVGWSLGGGVALEFAAKYPKSVVKMVLINSTTHRGYPVFKKGENGQFLIGEVYGSKEELALDPIQVVPLLNALNKKDFATMNYIFDKTIYTVNKPSEIDNHLWINESLKQRNLVDVDWALANLNMSEHHNYYSPGTKMISQIKVPILHTWGSKDIVVPEYMVQENVNALKENSQLITYEKCGHSPLVDVPDQLANDIMSFIRS